MGTCYNRQEKHEGGIFFLPGECSQAESEVLHEFTFMKYDEICVCSCKAIVRQQEDQKGS